MIRIAISQAAFEAIARTLPLGSVGYENQVDANGQRLIWLEPRVVDRLKAMRGSGESYSDVILRLSRPPWRLKQKDRLAAVSQMSSRNWDRQAKAIRSVLVLR